VSGDNLNNVRRDTVRIFRKKKGECLKERINELLRANLRMVTY